MRIDNLLTKDTAKLEEFVFPLPAFALMGNWNFGKHSISTADAQNSTFVSPPQKSRRFAYKRAVFCRHTK